MNRLPRTALCLAMMALPALAPAQQKSRPHPADAGVAVPPVVYGSPIRQYQLLGDEAVTSWKTANEEVEKAGGWKAYLREGQQPSAAPRPTVVPPPTSTPPSKPAASDGNAGHNKP